METPETRSTIANSAEVIVAARMVSDQIRAATAEAFRLILECKTSIRQADLLLDEARRPYPVSGRILSEMLGDATRGR